MSAEMVLMQKCLLQTGVVMLAEVRSHPKSKGLISLKGFQVLLFIHAMSSIT